MCPDRWDGTDEAADPLLGPALIHISAPGIDPVPLHYAGLDGVEIRPDLELRLVTQNSIWLLHADFFRRMSPTERTMAQEAPIEGRIEDDGRWHRYYRAWFRVDSGWLRVRILPAAGEEIYTARIVAIGGTWDEIAPGSTEQAGMAGSND